MSSAVLPPSSKMNWETRLRPNSDDMSNLDVIIVVMADASFASLQKETVSTSMIKRSGQFSPSRLPMMNSPFSYALVPLLRIADRLLLAVCVLFVS